VGKGRKGRVWGKVERGGYGER